MNTNMLERRNSMAGVNGVNIILGLWVLISPFVLGFAGATAVMWNSVAVGIVVVLAALSRNLYNHGAEILNVILGIWLIVSAFVLVPMTAVPFWNSIILGIVIALAALVASGMHRSTPERTAPPHTP